MAPSFAQLTKNMQHPVFALHSKSMEKAESIFVYSNNGTRFSYIFFLNFLSGVYRSRDNTRYVNGQSE